MMVARNLAGIDDIGVEMEMEVRKVSQTRAHHSAGHDGHLLTRWATTVATHLPCS